MKAINRRYKKSNTLNSVIKVTQSDKEKMNEIKEITIRSLIGIENFEYSLERIERRVTILWQYFPMAISLIAALAALAK